MEGSRKSWTTHLLARRAAGLVLVAGVLTCSAASAQAADPAIDFAPGTPAFQAAELIARDYWQAAPCAGQVTVVWMGLAASTNATSSWTNPVGQYDAPEQNGSCQVAFNKALAWDWTRFCSILVHEYGHLAGRSHADDAADVMYAYYEAPVAQCVAAAPAQPAPPPPAEIAAAPAPEAAAAPAGESSQLLHTTTKPRAISSSRAVKRGHFVVVGKSHRAKRHGAKRRRGSHRRDRAQRSQHQRQQRRRHGRRVGLLVRA